MTSSLRIYLFIGFSWLLYSTLVGQREATHWHFGDGISLDFSSGVPVLNPPSSMFTQEGCASMSDQAGNLLFYTNGGGRPPATGSNPGMIWNRNHEVMYNMEGTQGGGFSARQSAVAFPVPGQEQQYYLFTMEEEEFDVGGTPPDQPMGRGLSYFIIDMNLNGGLGGVSLIDQRVYVPAFDGLTAIRMSGQNGYWVIAHASSVELIVVPVTDQGVGEPQLNVVEGQGSFAGQIKATPDGQWIFCNRRLFRFDPATGTPLVGPSLLLPNISALTTEFTADSRYLYTIATNSPGRRIARYDLQNPDILASASALFLFNSPGLAQQMQLGPNGSLYFLEEDSGLNQQGLSEITCPGTNQPGVNRFVVPLPGQTFLIGLPNYPAHIFTELASTDDTLVVVNDSLLLCADTPAFLNPINRGAAYAWSDGSTDSTLTISIPGNYQVTITGSCQPVVESFTIENFPPLEASIQLLTDTSLLCAGQDTISLTYEVNQDFEAFSWAILGLDEMTFVIDTFRFPVRDGGQTIVFSISNDCETIRDTFTYQNDTFAAQLTTDAGSRLCPGDEVSLFIEGTNISSLSWENDSEDLVRIVASADSSINYLARVVGLCGDTLVLAAELDYSGCPVVCDAVIPNLISPNRDGVNDAFKVLTNCDLEDYQLRIFNRWGQVVHDTSDQADVWDGNYQGHPQAMDVYFYQLRYRFPDNPELFEWDGQFSLVR